MSSEQTRVTEPDSGRDGPANIDELRQRLRALGYLDAGVDRFVLGAAAEARPVRLALSASLRIGTVAAILLGPAAAVGLATRMPGLVTGPRDAAVAALYLGILLGSAVAFAALLASLAASSLVTTMNEQPVEHVRRARILAIAAGVLVSSVCLGYLTLWWQALSPQFTGSPMWTAFALAIAAGISVLLGHAVTVTALAVTMARPRQGVLSARVPGASWKAWLLGGAVAFAGAATLLFAVTRAETSNAGARIPLTVRSSTPVIVLAIDGFDVGLYEAVRPPPDARPLPSVVQGANHGLFPVFDSARAQLRPSDSRDPARLWTTVATGVRPEKHGVGSLETVRVAGLQGRLVAGSTGRVLGAATDLLRLTRPAIASNVERRAKAFWEIAEQAGLRTAVVNWWATWPVSNSQGIVLSDRAVLRLERGGPLDAELGPADLYAPLQKQWSEIRKRAQQNAQATFERIRQQDLRQILTRAGELDIGMMRLAEAIVADRKLDLLVVYLPGLDIAQHALLHTDAGTLSAFELNTRLSALRAYYPFLHSLTGTLVNESWRADHIVFVVTQTGRLHDSGGAVAALGPGLSRGARAEASVLDVAPTILHALGVPIARDLDGHVIDTLFESSFLASNPVRFVDTYGPRDGVSAVRTGTPLDQEVIERLRSLGYVR